MLIQVHFSIRGQGVADGDWTIPIQCGAGTQILRWLAFAACSRLAYIRGDVPSSYVPQAVKTADGVILDADAVLNEVLQDSATVHVEFGSGPLAFKSRWEGRPSTPKMDWQDLNPQSKEPDAWLKAVDLRAYGLDKLVSDDMGSEDTLDPEQELAAVKEVLTHYAGPLQAIFLWYSAQGEELAEKDFGLMALEQFVKLLQDSAVHTDKYGGSQGDACFQKTLLVKKGPKEQQLKLPDFLVALCYIAAGKYKMGLENDQWGFPRLADKLLHLLTDCLLPNIGPELTARLEDLQESNIHEALVTMEENRQLTKALLESCKLKRAMGDEELRVSVKQMLPHLQKWNLFSDGLDLGLASLLTIYALQDQPSLSSFHLVSYPPSLTAETFQRFLLGAAYHAFSVSTSDKNFEDGFLREFLKSIYTRAGVLDTSNTIIDYEAKD